MNGDGSLIVARALLYGGTLVAFGLPFYLLLAPAAARLRLERQRWVTGCVVVAALVGVAGTVAHLILLSAAMNGVAAGQVDHDMIGFVGAEMPVGRAALVRLAALAILAVLALTRTRRLRVGGCVIAGAVAIGSLAWNGHAMMNDGPVGWAHVAADQVHLLAAGTWLGALTALLGLTRADDEDAVLARRDAFVGFAFVGTLAVAALIVTGIVNGAMILFVPGGGAPSRGYVLLLGLKVALFLGALALAAHNRFHLTPALDREGTGVRLRRSVAIELGLVAGTIVVISVLGLLSPTA